MFVRERTPRWIILYGVYLYLSGLSYREASAALRPFVDRCWTAVWFWVQGLGRRVEGLFLPRAREAWVDETQVWIHGEPWWLWVAVDPETRAILRLWVSPTRSGLSALPSRGLRQTPKGLKLSTLSRYEPQQPQNPALVYPSHSSSTLARDGTLHTRVW